MFRIDNQSFIPGWEWAVYNKPHLFSCCLSGYSAIQVMVIQATWKEKWWDLFKALFLLEPTQTDLP